MNQELKLLIVETLKEFETIKFDLTYETKGFNAEIEIGEKRNEECEGLTVLVGICSWGLSASERGKQTLRGCNNKARDGACSARITTQFCRYNHEENKNSKHIYLKALSSQLHSLCR